MVTIDLVDKLLSYEEGKLDGHEQVELFGELVRRGLAWKLQGSYGRTAQMMIDEGWIDKNGKVLI